MSSGNVFGCSRGTFPQPEEYSRWQIGKFGLRYTDWRQKIWFARLQL